ncbi:YitT family protein [Alkalihalobacillus sp. MEB130]|uniref:YitT family protein n=1 Tax=Alkalihalobacillus sp. MEB130 TaxID=2976704 RepID=UPI0028DFB8F4|nr:YitT family protein [Alkalihalobacillus sp. MEB130]MDT8862691.1 YitT family protein [Alkalihalobacillus sp. MEB130]
MKLLNVVLGCLVVSMGVLILQSSQVTTGGTAGLALSLTYGFDIPFSVMFFFINIPFYILAVMKMGWKFTLSTMFAVTTMSVLTEVIQYLPSFSMTPWVGAILGGTVAGLGLSILFLNGSSLGGANILSLYVQKRFHFNPGITTFVFDFIVIFIGLFSIGLIRGLYSILSIVMISYIISFFKGKIAAENTTKTRAVRTTQPSAS